MERKNLGSSVEKPRLLVLSSTFPRWTGDKEPRFVYDLSRGLADTFEVHVVAPHIKRASRLEHMDGMTIHRFKYFPEMLQDLAYEGGILEKIKRKPWVIIQIPFLIAAQIIFIRRLLHRMPFKAIHAHWIIPQGLCAVLAQLGNHPKVPILCTSHGGDLFALRGQLFDILRRRILHRCSALTVVSHAMAKKIRGSGIKTRCQVIPMGTDLEKVFTPQTQIQRRKNTILFVGRLVENKGVQYLLEAFRDLLQRFPDAELWIVGGGPEEIRLKKQASRVTHIRSVESLSDVPDPSRLSHSPGSITFFGPVAHWLLPGFYRSANVTVVPSVDHEGLGLVIVEAMGCGCPVVASDLPAIRDLIRHNQTGLLVPSKNSYAIAKTITKLLENPGLQQRLMKRGRKVTSTYGWNWVTERYRILLVNLVENGKD